MIVSNSFGIVPMNLFKTHHFLFLEHFKLSIYVEKPNKQACVGDSVEELFYFTNISVPENCAAMRLNSPLWTPPLPVGFPSSGGGRGWFLGF